MCTPTCVLVGRRSRRGGCTSSAGEGDLLYFLIIGTNRWWQRILVVLPNVDHDVAWSRYRLCLRTVIAFDFRCCILMR